MFIPSIVQSESQLSRMTRRSIQLTPIDCKFDLWAQQTMAERNYAVAMLNNITLGDYNGAQCGTADLLVPTTWSQFIGTLQRQNTSNWDNIELSSNVNFS